VLTYLNCPAAHCPSLVLPFLPSSAPCRLVYLRLCARLDSTNASNTVTVPASTLRHNLQTDLCLSNGIVKAGTGLAVGIVASAILFRRTFPPPHFQRHLRSDAKSIDPFLAFSPFLPFPLLRFSSLTGRPWPVFLGLGFGIGQGYSDCERVFNPAAVPGFRIAGEAQVRFYLSTSSLWDRTASCCQ
jgi:hypothetical protein